MQDRATATTKTRRKIGDVQPYSFGDMRADKQTDKQTDFADAK